MLMLAACLPNPQSRSQRHWLRCHFMSQSQSRRLLTTCLPSRQPPSQLHCALHHLQRLHSPTSGAAEIEHISWSMPCCCDRSRPHLQFRPSQHASLAANCCRSYPATIPASQSDVLSNDPLMSYIKSQLQSKRSHGDSAMLASGSSGSRSVDLGSFGSQGSVQFDDLEIMRPCGEGSFGKVRCRLGVWMGAGLGDGAASRQAEAASVKSAAMSQLPLPQVYEASWHQTPVAVKVLQVRTEGAGRQGRRRPGQCGERRWVELSCCQQDEAGRHQCAPPSFSLLQSVGRSSPSTRSCWGG